MYVHNHRDLSPSTCGLVIVGRSARQLACSAFLLAQGYFFSLISFLFYYLMYMVVLPACMTVLHVSLFFSKKPEEVVGSLGAVRLWAAMVVLGFKPESSGRATSALKLAVLKLNHDPFVKCLQK